VGFGVHRPILAAVRSGLFDRSHLGPIRYGVVGPKRAMSWLPFLRKQPPQLSQDERYQIAALSSDLPAVWHAPGLWFFEHTEFDELSRTFALKIIAIRARWVLIPEQSGLQCRHRSTHGGWTGTGYGGPPYKRVQGWGCSTHRAVSCDLGWIRKVLANKPIGDRP
jgi:hypothetical protein